MVGVSGNGELLIQVRGDLSNFLCHFTMPYDAHCPQIQIHTFMVVNDMEKKLCLFLKQGKCIVYQSNQHSLQ